LEQCQPGEQKRKKERFIGQLIPAYPKFLAEFLQNPIASWFFDVRAYSRLLDTKSLRIAQTNSWLEWPERGSVKILI